MVIDDCGCLLSDADDHVKVVNVFESYGMFFWFIDDY